MNGSATDFSRKLLRWYDRHRRDLPWRQSREPYRILVSEAMLQQTQVATVIPYFHRFIERFPTLEALAAAPEQDVLRLWQGLGYYSRARNLQRAASAIVSGHAGKVPQTVEALRKLPGVGRYTAGAVASIAFDVRAPIVDGNVARVICRLDKIDEDPRQPKTVVRLWQRAEAILPKRRAGDFNSALMELGATVCIPRTPRCLVCPVRTHCEALQAGLQNQIPRPRIAKPTPLHRRDVFCLRRTTRGVERWLIEQRPARGRWAGLWQFVTVQSNGDPSQNARSVAKGLGLKLSLTRKIGKATHSLTHRRYIFEVFHCECGSGGECSFTDMPPRRWVTLAELDAYPLSRPQLKVAAMLDSDLN